MINILLNGSNGKMGKAICEYIKDSTIYNLLYCIDKNNNDLFYSISKKPDVIIDFSTPKATFNALDYAIKNLIPIVIATTGFSKNDEDKIKEFAEAIPIFKSSNMSYGINIFSNIVSSLAKKLNNVDIEIIEKHHRNKADAPSGTAIMIADNINKACNNRYSYNFSKNNFNNTYDSKNSNSKKIKSNSKSYNEIGFSSIRGGKLVGEHTVLFLGENETFELTHTAYSRTIYIEGALKAAEFIITKKNGLYSMNDRI